MLKPAPDRTHHVVRFQNSEETDAFVRALQRFLEGPRGEAWTTKFHITEVWAPSALAERPLEVYLSDSALMAAEAAFAEVPVVGANRGDELPANAVLVLKGAELQ